MLKRQCAHNLARIALMAALPGLTAGEELVTGWNTVALKAIRAGNVAPPMAARNLAVLHAAIYDAVNGIAATHESYLVPPGSPADASAEAAACAAARRVLLSQYPEQLTGIESAFRTMLGQSGSGSSAGHAAGLQWGETVALAILRSRNADGSDSLVDYIPGTQPGQWRPTVSFGGVIRPALLPNWRNLAPFALLTASQFRPPPPPLLGSVRYALEFNQVKSLGAMGSRTRTPDQTQIAHFWAYGPGTATPPGHWNQIAQAVVARMPEAPSLGQTARLFALLNIAMADAAIVSWDSKYQTNFWRPIAAIQEAAADGNPDTEPDPAWRPLLDTPPFPEYTSGHSTFSGAAALVLTHFFASDSIPFSVGSDDLPGVTRTYRRFSEAAKESGVSRIYGGIHFSSANIHGLTSGAAVGTYVSWNLLRPLDPIGR